MVSILCNNGLRQRHWDAMSNLIGENITPDSGTTLRKMLKNDIGPHVTQFETISTGASKVLFFIFLFFTYIPSYKWLILLTISNKIKYH